MNILVDYLGIYKEDRVARWLGGVELYKTWLRNSITTRLCPYTAAHDSGVRPYLESLESTSALPVSSSSLTTASCPFSAAHDSGVRPYEESLKSTSALPVPSSSFATALSPKYDAMIRELVDLGNSYVLVAYIADQALYRFDPISQRLRANTAISSSLCIF